MGVDMSSNPPPTKDFFPSPALSLSLAGIFRGAAAAAEAEAAAGGDHGGVGDEGDEGSVGGGGGGMVRGRREETVEISSENSGPARSRSGDDFEGEDDDEDGDGGGGGKKKKRKKYHRHTAEQIREMEALFKDSPHPDEKQRQQLSKQLGLHPRQVKFWFQNRRTQIKAIQERHENSLLKSEIDKLKEENKSLRDAIQKSSCPSCGFASTGKDATQAAEDQQLRIENAKLKAELEKLRSIVGKQPPGTEPPSTSSSAGSDQENKSSLDFYTGVFGIDKSKIMDTVNQALEELQKMAAAGEPLWVRSVETGREILNYDEYMREFSLESSSNGMPKRSIEASRETGVVFVDIPRLVGSFMDVNQWTEMFPGLISKAATVDVIVHGDDANRSGTVQLMFAELQMPTPMVPTREIYFVRYCKQLSSEQWAIVDVSIDKVEENIDASLVKCRKRPSGCIIEDKSNGHCKVTWVEHLECQRSTIHTMYRSIVSSGLAFGARHWMATLQLQCERLVFFMATNVPAKDSNGVATLAGRKSILKLAQRMSWGFCRALGASSFNSWTKVPSKTGEDIRVSSRKNLNDPGEPIGVILCAVSSVWLPVSPGTLFDFLRDDARRHEWDVMANGGQVQSIANLAKGQDRGNSVTVQAIKSKENSMWVVQDCSTNAYESMVVYAHVDISSMQSVMTGCDSGSIAVLPSGFSILPDGLESRPLVISSRQEEKNSDAGSLLTIGLQIVSNASPTAKVSMESLESITALMSCTLRNIKTSLQCEDG
ncbi:Homeobox-leucine zipper protein GLABRA 2-like protein [Drosera capensis]